MKDADKVSDQLQSTSISGGNICISKHTHEYAHMYVEYILLPFYIFFFLYAVFSLLNLS